MRVPERGPMRDRSTAFLSARRWISAIVRSGNGPKCPHSQPQVSALTAPSVRTHSPKSPHSQPQKLAYSPGSCAHSPGSCAYSPGSRAARALVPYRVRPPLPPLQRGGTEYACCPGGIRVRWRRERQMLRTPTGLISGTRTVPSRNAAYKAAVTRSAVVPGLNRLAGCRSQESKASSRSRASPHARASPRRAAPAARCETSLACASPYLRTINESGCRARTSSNWRRSRFRAASPRPALGEAPAALLPEPRGNPLAYCRAIESRSAAMAIDLPEGDRRFAATSWSETSPRPPGWASRIAR